MITITISEDAFIDLHDGFDFYENQEAGLGDYFASQLRADIDGLKITAGIHLRTHRDLHRLLSRKFPYAIFYRFNSHGALVLAVVDCRKEPDWIEQHLSRL